MLEKLAIAIPQLILLDIMLPGIDGIDIITRIKRVKSFKDILIMIISAKTSELDKVIGLDVGADDYLAKPFGVLELVSRVKALLRRNTFVKDEKILDSHGYRLHLKSHTINYKTEKATLTKKQFELLKYLMIHEGSIISREELLNHIWGYEFVGESRTLDVHMKEVRKKLYVISNEKNQIETIRGIGYKLSL